MREEHRQRIQTHRVFDQIWKLKLHKSRGAAYKWMRQAMGLSKSQAYISKLSHEQCQRLIELVYHQYPKLRDRYSSLLLE